MFIVNSHDTNPYFNIAAEEYLLKEKIDNFLILYVNEPSIIVGKHQNTLAEINYRYVVENGIRVIRRISGGGTVFHDFGNLNFTFIVNGKEGHLVDFKKFTKPLLEVIQSLEIDAKLEGKNDLRVNGLKISGNAEHVFKNRVLHHGTLLIDSDLQMLSEGLKVIPGKYIDKAVKSIRSKVANLNEFLLSKISVEEFKKLLTEKINWQFYEYTKTDIEAINKLITDKYLQWNWNFGYSPSYEFTNSVIINGKNFHIGLSVENGLIKNCQFPFSQNLETFLIDMPHEYSNIKNTIAALAFYKPNFEWNFF